MILRGGTPAIAPATARSDHPPPRPRPRWKGVAGVEVSEMIGDGTAAISPPHGQDLPPAPAATPPVAVAESRGRERKSWGRGGADHHQGLPRAHLRLPSPEKGAPRAEDSRSGRHGRARHPRSRRGVSAMVGVGEPTVGHDLQQPDPPTRARSRGPGPERSRPCRVVVRERGGPSSFSHLGPAAPSLAEENGPGPTMKMWKGRAPQLESRREGSAMLVGGTPAIRPRHSQDLPPAPAATPQVAGRRDRATG